jgi:hypothetical protein
MKPEELFALFRAFEGEKDAARAALAPGEYPVSTTVRVDGVLTVRVDTSKKPTVSIPWTAVVAVLLQRMGCTRESAISVLTEILPTVVGKDGFKTVLKEADVKKIGAEALERLKDALPETPVKGGTSFDGVITPVV